jgi:hypothetical protein
VASNIHARIMKWQNPKLRNDSSAVNRQV